MPNASDFTSRLFFAGVLLSAIAFVYLSSNQAHPQVNLGDKTFQVSLASTEQSRQKGLSGSLPLAATQGMLFVFERGGYPAIWMKDMLFSIDIVWINRDGVVVHIEREVSPDTYPRVFSPPVPARYVLEIPAGSTKNIKLGILAKFTNVPSSIESD